MRNKIFYHGTTSKFELDTFNNELLPAIETGNLRETFRNKHNDIVFVTSSLPSAIRYAHKAAEQFGGSPVVYKVKPLNYWQLNLTEFACEKAIIKEVVYES